MSCLIVHKSSITLYHLYNLWHWCKASLSYIDLPILKEFVLNIDYEIKKSSIIYAFIQFISI
jgi:hypothetical protein